MDWITQQVSSTFCLLQFLIHTFSAQDPLHSLVSSLLAGMEDEVGFRFFRVLLHGFSSKLLLPCVFVKQLNGRRREVVTLLSPNGKMWDVDCHKDTDNKEVFLGGTSWQDFTCANNLREGFFLVFHYKGNMLFSFRAFDLSTREVAYAPVTEICTKRKKEMIVGDSVVVLDSEDVGESVAAVSKKKRKCYDKEPSEDPLIRAQFELTVEPFNLSRRRWCMKIPEEISSSSSLLKTHIDKITVEGPNGRKFTVGLQCCARSHAIYISKGWAQFVHANELKAGDKCIFELSSQSKKDQLIVKIQIASRSTPVVTPFKPLKVRNSSNLTNRMFSRFQATIKLYNLARNFLHLPVEFVEHNGLGECCRLKLKNSIGQMWLVTVARRNKRGGRHINLSQGWLDFARGNKLGLGDICTFEMVRKDEGIVLQVHVEKKKLW